MSYDYGHTEVALFLSHSFEWTVLGSFLSIDGVVVFTNIYIAKNNYRTKFRFPK